MYVLLLIASIHFTGQYATIAIERIPMISLERCQASAALIRDNKSSHIDIESYCINTGKS